MYAYLTHVHSVCALSIVRLCLLQITADTTDFTFDNVSTAFWSCIETNATIAVACFATMKPLLSKWFPNLTEPRITADPERDGSPQAHQIHVSGRVPTIGSAPLRPGQHRWTQLAVSRDREEKGEVVEVSIEMGEKGGRSVEGGR